MTKLERISAILISAICFFAILARILWPCILIDERTIYLIILGSLPWLALFFKEMHFPGVKVITRDRAQGRAEEPIPPVTNVPPVSTTAPFSPHAVKILATLWRYQKQIFGDDHSKRWTFAVFPNAPVYLSYLTGLLELLNAGLVALLPDYQVLLTNEGIHYIEKHPEIQADENVYTF
jgi:hypothetical protein